LGVISVLGTAETGFYNGEASLHEHDQKACNQRPDKVNRDLILADLVHYVRKRYALFRIGHRDVSHGSGDRAARIALETIVVTRSRDTLEVGVRDGYWWCLRGRRCRGRGWSLRERQRHA
jgi:hypothetical protein